MIKEILTRQFTYNYEVLKMNTDGLSDEDALAQPTNGGNSLNWVLGHIIATRDDILKILDQEPLWDEQTVSLYKRGSFPISNLAEVVSLNRLLENFESSQQHLISALEGMDTTDKRTVEKLAGLSFHESYHVGQTGLLRRIAGKDGVIK